MRTLLKKLVPFKKKRSLKYLSELERGALLDFSKKLRKIQEKKFSNYEMMLWDLYPQFIRASQASYWTPDPEYAKIGYKQGCISEKHIEHLKSMLKNADSYPISHDDYDPNYSSHADLRPFEESLNASHKLFVLDQPLLEAMQPIIDELKIPVAQCLGTPWRVINVLCWETFPEALDVGPNSWHTDGLPFAVNKVMIYLNGASTELGTTSIQLPDGSIKHVEGPPGTWFLFKISEIIHQGVKPKTGSRIALEVRVVPAFNFDLRPYSAGFNAHYPKCPWYQPHAVQ